MASVRRLQPVIQERVDVLLKRLKGYKDTGEVLNASRMFGAFTNGESVNYVDTRQEPLPTGSNYHNHGIMGGIIGMIQLTSCN